MAAALAPHESDESPIYAGTCKPKLPQPIADLNGLPRKRGRAPALRLNVEAAMAQLGERFLYFHDLVFGSQTVDPVHHFGDYVVRRVDGIAAYQLACAYDDWHMKCGLVLRGADLLKSTGRQLLLFALMGWSVPDFAHVGLICDSVGNRLAKRDHSISISQLRSKGIAPEQVRDVFHQITYPNEGRSTTQTLALDQRLRRTVKLPVHLPWSGLFA